MNRTVRFDLLEPLDQLALQVADAACIRQELVHVLASCAKSGNVVEAFGARPQSVFLMAAMQKRREGAALFDIQGADALWTVNFVRRERGVIDIPSMNVDRNFTERLRAIGEHEHIALSRDLRNRGDVLKHTG